MIIIIIVTTKMVWWSSSSSHRCRATRDASKFTLLLSVWLRFCVTAVAAASAACRWQQVSCVCVCVCVYSLNNCLSLELLWIWVEEVYFLAFFLFKSFSFFLFLLLDRRFCVFVPTFVSKGEKRVKLNRSHAHFCVCVFEFVARIHVLAYRCACVCSFR